MKKNLKKSVVVGVCTAAFMSAQVAAFAGSTPQSGQVGDMAMTSSEQEFANKLSGSSKDTFMKMNSDDRAMAMKIANHSCKGQNSCKGQGGCKTDANSCRGKNSCKGKGACKSTADQAVKMAQKRHSM
jgi:hypothetical protein